MNDQTLKRKVKILQALADETRLNLVRKIAQGPLQGSSCASLQMTSCLSQPAMSHHFKILSEAGIITEQKDGRAKSYKVNEQALGRAGLNLDKLIN